MTSTLSRSTPLPLYFQLAQILRGKILNGEWKPGEKIFSEPELVNLYKVSRQVARSAVDMLILEGFLERKHGKGTFVTFPKEKEQDEVQKVYAERNMCIALLCRMAQALNLSLGIGKHQGENWDEEWQNVVFIDLPAGQVSWHIKNSELENFNGIPAYHGEWDGHDQAEKYRRVLRPGL